MTDRSKLLAQCETAMRDALDYALAMQMSSDARKSERQKAADYAVIILALRAQAEALA